MLKKPSMVRLHYSVTLHYQVQAPGADFIFNLQAAHTRQQQVVSEQVRFSQQVQVLAQTDALTQTRWLRLQAPPGTLTVSCDTVVDIRHHRVSPAKLLEHPVAALPLHVLPYLYPSRYCESDKLHATAVQALGTLAPGYKRVLAIQKWVRSRVKFVSNSSTGTTSACDTLASGQGVCRDFAHLMIALCRALNIPARFVTGFDYGADPALGPPDFHAYVEVWLSGRWYMFDPSGTAIPMGFVRLATGHDAADAAFATLFGPVQSGAPEIHLQALPLANGELVLPEHISDALSTDGGSP